MLPARMGILESGTGKVGQGSNESYDAFEPTPRDTIARRLHARSLKRILKMDQSWKDNAQFYPPLPPPPFLSFFGDTDHEKTVRELLEHLDDRHYTAYVTTLTFRSSVLDRYLKNFVGGNETSNTLPQLSPNTTSIMHCGALLPLKASALTISSTIHLITGARVYVVYPPTPQNIVTVQNCFLDLTKSPRPNHAALCSDLQGGITFVQRAGQTVTIPSLSPTLVLSTRTSTSVTIRSRCHDDVPIRVKHLDLMVAQIKAVQHVYQETADASLEYHVKQLYRDLLMVLNASEPSTPRLRLALALGAAWREKNTCFQILVENYVSEPLKEQIQRNIPRLWNLALRNQGLRESPVCNVDLEDLAISFAIHFQKAHWDQIEEVYLVNNGSISILDGLSQ